MLVRIALSRIWDPEWSLLLVMSHAASVWPRMRAFETKVCSPGESHSNGRRAMIGCAAKAPCRLSAVSIPDPWTRGVLLPTLNHGWVAVFQGSPAAKRLRFHHVIIPLSGRAFIRPFFHSVHDFLPDRKRQYLVFLAGQVRLSYFDKSHGGRFL